ncbi:MAG: UDP-glucose--hexose-1-phosphate uridylyltransferase [Clostridia bacterium]|nr:UDP-glucose--hexose-1-phosphate uridylyltransferase [Clostridia bacterium]
MINEAVAKLVRYSQNHALTQLEDETYITNALMAALGMTEYEKPREIGDCEDLEAILGELCDYAWEHGMMAGNTVAYRDLFDTMLMGILTPRPSQVIAEFRTRYEKDRRAATDWFYDFSRATDYIRTYRVKKDLKWVTPSQYGDIDITINLSKPEKDPKAIAAAKLAPQSGYPKCALCRENEGFAGNLRAAARENHRILPITLEGEPWFLQYSPYVYYNEHCIVLSGEHRPMKIERKTFARMLDFVGTFPHYFVGSNADLPIVGGSILSHDHMQGGHYTFAMERAPIEREISFVGYENVHAGIVRWPMSVIRLQSDDKNALVNLANNILIAWRGYTDEAAFVYAETDGEAHNTITPIARRRGNLFELDLVLRNNITTEEHPLGVYHPHKEYHNIKKENIGLIEVMGLAVLPARLKDEMKTLADTVLAGKNIADDPAIAHHADWFAAFSDNYTFDENNITDILHREIGNTFVHVLEDAGVYKCTEEGRAAMMRFIDSMNV